MNYRITRIVGVKDDIEVVKLSCYKKIKITPQEYNRKLRDFYDSWGVRLDYVEVDATPIVKGQRGGRKPIINSLELLKFKEANPQMSQNDIAKHFKISKQAVSYKLNKIKNG